VRSSELACMAFQDEQYDFAIPKSRLERPAVQAFLALLAEEETRQHLRSMGFTRM
jgi:putative molybdopterin biosynthesis protein